MSISSKERRRRIDDGEFYPASWLRYLKTESAGFRLVPATYQHALAANLWTATNRRFEHSGVEGAFVMPWRGRQMLYGSAQAFHQINVKLDWFCLEQGAKPSEGMAQAWTLTDRSHSLIQGYFDAAHIARTTTACGLLTPGGTPYRIPADGIRSRTTDGGNTTHARREISAAIEINGQALHVFHEAADTWMAGEPCPDGFEWAHAAWAAIAANRGPNGGIERARARAESAAVQASAMLHIAKASSVPGFVLPTVYLEHPTGRLFAEGAHNLQSCQREVRRAALMGWWDVDISNCHWSLLQQMARRVGKETPAIGHYLSNKAAVRAEIAMAGGVSTDDAKKVLLGMIYGMNLHATEDSRRRAILELVGANAAQRLRTCLAVLALFDEVRSVRGAVLQDYEGRSRRRGYLVNDRGRLIEVTAPPAVKLAHVLQGAESVILGEVIREHGPSIKLLAHDGWVMTHKPDVQHLADMLHARCGYLVEIEAAIL